MPRLELLLELKKQAWYPANAVIVLPGYVSTNKYMLESLQYYPFNYKIIGYFDKGRAARLYQVGFIAPPGNSRPGIMAAIRHRILSYYDLENTTPLRKVWISRRKAPKRKIIDEEELLPLLRERGWEVVVMEDLSFVVQVRLMSESRAIAGLHGAGLTNMLFMKPGGHVLEVRFEGDAHNNCYFSLAGALDHRYSYFLARMVDGKAVYEANAEVDRNLFVQCLDRLEHQLRLDSSK